jgi:hypothetical protein
MHPRHHESLEASGWNFGPDRPDAASPVEQDTRRYLLEFSLGAICKSCFRKSLTPEFQRVLYVNEAEYIESSSLDQILKEEQSCGFESVVAYAIVLALGKHLYARCTPDGPMIDWKLKNKCGKLGIMCLQPPMRHIFDGDKFLEEITAGESEMEWYFVKGFGLSSPTG